MASSQAAARAPIQVYVLFYDCTAEENESPSIHGVYANLEAAQAAARDGVPHTWTDYGDEWLASGGWWTIYRFTVEGVA